ncbi:allatostatin-A receptor-like [Oculina patagonica]
MLHTKMSTNSTNSSVSNLQTTPQPTALAYSYLLRVAFGIIALMAFVSNGLLCVVILKNRKMLRSAYNLLIFSLAVTDLLTGIFLGITPNYLIALDAYQAPSGMLGVVFCKIIGSQYFVFLLGKVSVLTVTSLALERWYSVVKPVKYKLTFKRRRVFTYLAIIWLICLLSHVAMPFGMTLNQDNLRCIWISVDYPIEFVIITYTVVTFFIPTVVMWVTYLHISLSLKSFPGRHNKRVTLTRFKLLRMCIIVALLLTVCWFPNQLYYALSSYELVKLETPFHHFTIVLSMFNSCTNPMIYCYTNQEYRRGFLSILCPLFNCFYWRRRQSVTITKEPRWERRSRDFDAEKFDGGVLLQFRYINQGCEALEQSGQMNTSI